MKKSNKFILVMIFVLMYVSAFAQTTTVSAFRNPFRIGTDTNTVILVKGESTDPMSVKVQIYDMLGKLVWSAERTEYMTGDYTVNWDGKNIQGIYVRSGVYVLVSTRLFQGDKESSQDKIRLAVIRNN